MSLEQALAENTAVMKQLIAVLQSGVIPAAPQPEGAKPAKGGKKASDTPPAGVTTGKDNALGTVEGDPTGTRYWLIEKHNTVYAQRPGEPDPGFDGAVITTAAQYLEKKAEYALILPTAAAGAPTGSPAAGASTAGAPTASSNSPATSAPAALDGPAIVAKCQALHKAQGNEGLKKVLDKFSVAKVPEMVAKTAQYGEIGAFIDALLNPQPAAAPAEPANLFG
jgi:hypothetical protein